MHKPGSERWRGQLLSSILLTKAVCRDSDPDELFVQGAAQNRAKQMCHGCAIRTECLADALDNRVEFGVWGGMTERERRALLRRRPDVRNWHDLLTHARDTYYAGHAS
jgi:WhiB family redox-sensing transcriptional regulator